MAGPKFNPDPIGQPLFRPQHPLRPEDLRIIARQSQQMARSQATGALNDTGGETGLQIGQELMPEGFFAGLIAPPISPSQPFYSFIEVEDSGDGINWISPNDTLPSYGTAYEGTGYVNINVPTAPQNLQADSTAGTDFWYTVTAVWENARGFRFQGPWSNEVGITGNGATLTWEAPAPYSLDTPPSIWPRSSPKRWAVYGYQIWGGIGPLPSQQNYLLGHVNQDTFTFTHDGSLPIQRAPIPGGDAGPVVWMQTRSVWGYFKFFYPSEPLLLAWVKVTSSDSQTVTLYGGGTLTLFPAVIEKFSEFSGDWSDQIFCWYYDVNGGGATADTRYQCRLLAMSHDCDGVWASTSIAKSSSRTCVIGPFVADVICADDNLTVDYKWQCIPDGDICRAYWVDDPSQCPITSPGG